MRSMWMLFVSSQMPVWLECQNLFFFVRVDDTNMEHKKDFFQNKPNECSDNQD